MDKKNNFSKRSRTLFYCAQVLILLIALPWPAGNHWMKGTSHQINSHISVEPEPDTVRFAVIGDYGIAGEPAASVASLVKNWNPDLILTVGDNNYPDGSSATIDTNIGQYYSDYIYPYIGSYGNGSTVNNFFPALGNHDWLTANAQPYKDYFGLPGNEYYYDFVRGPVHFFVLDSDANEPDGMTATSVQAQWLQNALAASTSAWKIVVLHHAPFSSGAHGSNTILQWPYQAWGADAVLAGHDHTYERIVQNDFPYFVNGLGGYSIYNFGTPVDGSQLRYNGEYGAMLVNANSSKIYFQFMIRNGHIVDIYALAKSNLPGPFASLDPGSLSFQEAASGLTQPVFITNAGDSSGRIFVLEQPGRIRVIKNGNLLATPFLNIQSIVKSTGSEQGLLALAFHPSYSTNGKFYVAYTAPRSGDSSGSNLVLEQFSVSTNNPDQANSGSGSILLTIDHPTNSNHNGGTLAFGQDGYLYWSTGDGGGAGDPNNNAQNLNSLLGKILRIDVNSGSPYGIPNSNPFFSSSDPNVKKEIWAYGLRNPWRLSFDRLTHDLYIGDVGQSAREEIDFQPASSSGGENYGWRVMEGSICFNPSSGCNQSGKVLPVAEYNHTLGCSVTGGYVYRGSTFPSLYGYYFYGDFCTGRLFSLYNNPQTGWTAAQIADTPYSISTFGEDEQGELYLADYATGKIYNIRHQQPPTIDTVGVFRPSNGALYLKNTNTTGFADVQINYGLAGDYPVVGDWDGDGDATIGIYRNGSFYLRNSNTIGFADIVFAFGSPGDQPIAGDWNNDGVDTIGVYRSSTGTFYLRNSNSSGSPSVSFALGIQGDIGIAGDWNGDGFDTTGVFRPSNGALYLKNTNATGFADVQINYGLPGDRPVTGDWNNDGIDTIGIYRNGTFYLRNSNTIGFADLVFGLGLNGDMPIAGNWDGLP
jgi:glucose/arabinose dehydrogenase